MKSPLVIAAVVVLLALGGYFFMKNSSPAEPSGEGQPVDAAMPVPTDGTPVNEMEAVKEFTMTAYYDEKGKWFSLNEMAVKKGERVRVKITNTKGMHDFVIDEYAINKELPLNEEVVVEFVADKAGSFVYYCSKPGHRAGGQWGTLTVSE